MLQSGENTKEGDSYLIRSLPTLIQFSPIWAATVRFAKPQTLKWSDIIHA